MRIYNATNSQISVPFPGGRLDIPAHSVSGNVGANTDVISLLVSAYSAEEIAFVVSGPFELNLCSSIPTVPVYTVQSLEEALARFNKGAKYEKKVAYTAVPDDREEVVCESEEECEDDECEAEEEDDEELPATDEASVDYPAVEVGKVVIEPEKPVKNYSNFKKKKHK